MQIDTGNSEPVSQRPHSIAMKHCKWVKNERNNLLNVQVICSSLSSWSAPTTVGPKGNGRKCLVIDYRALNKVTQKFVWHLAKVEDIFSMLNCAKNFLTLNHYTWYHHIPFNEDPIPQNYFYISFRKRQISEGSFWTGTSTSIFPRTHE